MSTTSCISCTLYDSCRRFASSTLKFAVRESLEGLTYYSIKKGIQTAREKPQTALLFLATLIAGYYTYTNSFYLYYQVLNLGSLFKSAEIKTGKVPTYSSWF